ncbi:MAG: peptidase domain-containing ABC transporter, partial [Prochlorothrix sp.]|nr:peptidase domain-containing ABC transporter [Prochlorothrix sp.]
IVGTDSLPYYIWIVLEGRIRLLGLDPITQRNFTLQLLEPGEILGWAGLLRRSPCESAIASEASLCFILPAPTFLSLCEQQPGFALPFETQTSAAELCMLLRPYVQQHSHANLNLKLLIPKLLNQAIQIRYFPPAPQVMPALAVDCTWFISGAVPGSSLEPGHTLDLTNAKLFENLRQRLQNPLRLVGIPTFLLTPDTLASDASDLTDRDVIDRDTADREESGHSETQSEALPILSSAEVRNLPSSSDPYVETLQPRSIRTYPHVKGQGMLDGTLACFQMLAEYLGVKFRREPLRRVLQDQIDRSGTLNLNICGQISEMMGIKAQLVKVPSEVLSQLETPALIQWQEGFTVLYETSQRELVLGVPELGIMRRKPKEFSRTWGESGEVLLLQVTRSTPQEKFGLSWFLPSIKRFTWVLFLVLLASLFIQLFSLANPLIIQVIIDRVIVKNSTDTLQVLGFFLVIVAIFEAVLTYLRSYLFADTTNRIDIVLGSEIIDHLLRLPLNYFDKRPVGELSSRVNELERIRQFLTGTALTVVLDVLSSVIYVVVMVLYSPKLTAAALATIPLFVLLTAIFAPIIQRQLRTKAERNAAAQAHLVEVVSGIQTVKAQNVELRARWRWQELYARYVGAGFKTVQTATLSSAASGFLNKTSGLIVLWYGAFLVLNEELTLGQLIAFRIIAGYVTGPVLRLAQVWQNFQETALSLERLSDIVDTPQEATEEERNNVPMPSIQGHIQYEEVSFRFQGQKMATLANVTLDIAPGTFVGVVGQSGSGKSTLVKLLSRLYNPEVGRICIDQYDIAKVELYSLRRQIGIVPQDSLLFDGTVEENIALTRPHATIEEIMEAARIAVAHDFIMELPTAYNSPVGEKGANLSGGQRQRIAIARTVLQNPRLLIMDEATSALDYETERQVFENLMDWFNDRTVFFITHRLSTVCRAHQIVVMDRGSIVELGTHEDLMARRGRYYCLYQQQDALA